eukprot:6207940-Pleurochrysis_carterae.AAC.1
MIAPSIADPSCIYFCQRIRKFAKSWRVIEYPDSEAEGKSKARQTRTKVTHLEPDRCSRSLQAAKTQSAWAQAASLLRTYAHVTSVSCVGLP